jgi:hypothetical protein
MSLTDYAARVTLKKRIQPDIFEKLLIYYNIRICEIYLNHQLTGMLRTILS